MAAERVTFPGAFDEELAGLLDMPSDGGPWAYALFAHCFSCSKDLKGITWICRRLAEHGIATLRFDFTGLGESEGDFAATNFSSNIDDLIAAADFMRARHQAPQILIGQSLGGTAVLVAAPRVAESRAVVTIGAPSDTQHLRDTLIRLNIGLAGGEESEVTLGGQTFRIRRQLLEDLDEQNVRETIADVDRALLVFHSPIDRIVGIAHARRIFEAAEHPKSFVSLDGADHLLLERRDALHVAEVLAAWVRRYVRDPDAE